MAYLRTLAIFMVFFLITAHFTGCGGQKLPADMPKPYPVSVTVIQDEKPLPEASIALMHTDGKWSATGKTGADGVARDFYTNGTYKGVVPGKFKVVVKKIETEREHVEIPPEPTDPQEKYAWRTKYKESRTPPKEYDLVEKQYGDTKTTPLEIAVTSEKNEFSVDVGKGVRVLYKR